MDAMEARIAFLVRRLLGAACLWATAAPAIAQPAPAELLLVNGRVYTFAWDDPSPDGTPAANAPRSAAGSRPDAEAVAIRGDRIVFVGTTRDARAYRGQKTRLIDLGGATVLPGLVDSHTHIVGLGEAQSQVDLVGVGTEGEAVERVAAFAKRVPKGQWIRGRGWDEGAWANRYPTKKLLSERVPDHPVLLSGLHGFAVWANRLALERAGITRATVAPAGGEIAKDAGGEPTGLLLNRATSLLDKAVPEPTEEQYEGLRPRRAHKDGSGRLRRHPRGRRRSPPHERAVIPRRGRPAAGAGLRDALRPRRGPLSGVAAARSRSRERPDAHDEVREGPLRRRARLARGPAPRRLLGSARSSRSERQGIRLRPISRGRHDEGRLPGRHPRHRGRGQPRGARFHRVRSQGAAGVAGTASSNRTRPGPPSRRRPAFRPARCHRLDGAPTLRRGQGMGGSAARSGAREGSPPLVQLLHPDDALAALEAALARPRAGAFNVVPSRPIPLLSALHLAEKVPVPVPHPVAYAAADLLWAAGVGQAPAGFVDYVRFPFVADGEKARRELGFAARHSSRDALVSYLRYRHPRAHARPAVEGEAAGAAAEAGA